jgi:hypothetical protein
MVDGIGFGAGINPAVASAGCVTPTAVSPVSTRCKLGENGFLILLLLFILLASCTTMGREKNFFFIIILAIIAFGGFSRTFGLGESVL